jgi:hypothetical protein
MSLALLVFVPLALAIAALWWQVWGTRPTHRPQHPRGGTLEQWVTRRQPPWCVLCGKVGHTMQEHVRVPYSELEGMADPGVFVLPRVWHPSVHNVAEVPGKSLPTGPSYREAVIRRHIRL